MFNSILLCSDGSDYSLNAARTAAVIARRFKADVTLISAFNPSSLLLPAASAPEAVPPVETIMKMADEMHDEVQSRTGAILLEAGVSYRGARELGDPADVIVSAAECLDVDLVIFGSRGLSAWKSLLIGSVSDAVLHHAHCPVLIVRGEPTDFPRILVASDGSCAARHASLAAGAIAQRFGSQLTVLTVREPHVGVSRADAEALSEPILDSLLHMRDYPNVELAIQQETGHAADVIVRSARSLAVNLVVMGSRGLGGLQSVLLGSVSRRVAHQAHCSVLVVR